MQNTLKMLTVVVAMLAATIGFRNWAVTSVKAAAPQTPAVLANGIGDPAPIFTSFARNGIGDPAPIFTSPRGGHSSAFANGIGDPAPIFTSFARNGIGDPAPIFTSASE
ncbi:MAG: hypothetical protein ACRD1L_01425 [Terriglobales bacterium]